MKTFTTVALIAVLSLAGCSRKTDATKPNFEKAINSFYSKHPECLFPQPVRFPTRADTDKIEQTQGYDALTDLGFLQRQQDTKKTFIFGSKQVSDYDLSDKGRSLWTQDPQQPGFGNFCFGHRTVTSIDNFTANTSTNAPSTTRVDYHYRIEGAPDWAKNDKIKNAFPETTAALSAPQPATANLVLTADGWKVSTAIPE
jgi:hypothetical protein